MMLGFFAVDPIESFSLHPTSHDNIRSVTLGDGDGKERWRTTCRLRRRRNQPMHDARVHFGEKDVMGRGRGRTDDEFFGEGVVLDFTFPTLAVFVELPNGSEHVRMSVESPTGLTCGGRSYLHSLYERIKNPISRQGSLEKTKKKKKTHRMQRLLRRVRESIWTCVPP